MRFDVTGTGSCVAGARASGFTDSPSEPCGHSQRLENEAMREGMFGCPGFCTKPGHPGAVSQLLSAVVVSGRANWLLTLCETVLAACRSCSCRGGGSHLLRWRTGSADPQGARLLVALDIEALPGS